MTSASFFRFLAIALIVALASLSSCAHKNPSVDLDQGNVSTAFSDEVMAIPTVTYEFPDIPVPVEMKRVEGKTSIVTTPKFQGGVIVYTGRVTVSSLVEYFKKEMAKHGWDLTGSLTAERNFLAFSKGKDSHCLILLYDTKMGYQTEVQIWVTEMVK